ncbi:MAG: DUF456 domain-containing protein [Chloroflexi bacterium]|nr:DUF456 domain-containing protein [Chloroflexota bacterium]
MNATDSLLIPLAVLGMGVTLALSIVPFVPGPAIIWAIGTVFAVLDGFQRATPAAIIIMTLLMVIGSTSEIWMPALGIRSKGLSCLSTVGSVIGSIVGTFLIPIPLLGTIIGAIAGALLVELARGREVRRAVQAGRSVFQLYLIGIVVQFVTGFAMFVVFLVSLWMTG